MVRRHNICGACWQKKNPDRVPIKVRTDEIERCCFCGGVAADGIYIRASYVEARYCMEEPRA